MNRNLKNDFNRDNKIIEKKIKDYDKYPKKSTGELAFESCRNMMQALISDMFKKK